MNRGAAWVPEASLSMGRQRSSYYATDRDSIGTVTKNYIFMHVLIGQSSIAMCHARFDWCFEH